MKKYIPLLLALLICLSLTACGGKDKPDVAEPQDHSGVKNPVSESTAEEIAELTGINFNLPARAEDVSFSLIDSGDESKIAQAGFSLDGVVCNYRIVKSTGLKDISGMYYDWDQDETCRIADCSGALRFVTNQQGVCFWYDAGTGLLHCISVESDASSAYLIGLADYLYSLTDYSPEEDVSKEEAPPAQNGNSPADAPSGPVDAPSDAHPPEAAPGLDDEEDLPMIPDVPTEDTGISSAIAATAESLIGKAFEWGKSGPDAFDNSGFITYCLKANGISAGRTAAELYAGGTEVAQDALMPGDIVFFTYEDDGSPSYCGVYIGGGLFVAASNPEKPVGQVDMTEEHYQQRFVGARRYQ